MNGWVLLIFAQDEFHPEWSKHLVHPESGDIRVERVREDDDVLGRRTSVLIIPAAEDD